MFRVFSVLLSVRLPPTHRGRGYCHLAHARAASGVGNVRARSSTAGAATQLVILSLSQLIIIYKLIFFIPMPVLYGFGCMQRWKWEQYLEVLRRRTERNQKGICCCPAGSAIPCTGPLALSGDDETSTLWRSCKSHYLGRLCRQQNRLQ